MFAAVAEDNAQGRRGAARAPQFDGFANFCQFVRGEGIQPRYIGGLAGPRREETRGRGELDRYFLDGSIVGFEVTGLTGEEKAALAGFGIKEAGEEAIDRNPRWRGFGRHRRWHGYIAATGDTIAPRPP